MRGQAFLIDVKSAYEMKVLPSQRSNWMSALVCANLIPEQEKTRKPSLKPAEHNAK